MANAIDYLLWGWIVETAGLSKFNYEQGTNNFDKHYNIMSPCYLLAIGKNESDQAYVLSL